MYTSKFTGVRQNYILLALSQNAVGNIRSHHVAIGKTSISMKTINAQECFAEMYMLDAKTGQRANQTLTGGLVLTAKQYDLSR